MIQSISIRKLDDLVFKESSVKTSDKSYVSLRRGGAQLIIAAHTFYVSPQNQAKTIILGKIRNVSKKI